MFKISVPVMCSNVQRADREKSVEELKKINAERVFLALSEYIGDPDARKTAMEELKDNCAFYQAQGFEVGAWIWTFMFPTDTSFTHMTNPEGKISSRFCCPADPNFRKFAADYIADIARSGVSVIMFDDDYRYQNLGGVHCFCRNHVRHASELLGKTVSAEELAKKAFVGGENKYRKAWLQSNGDAFRSFAKEIRAAVDSVNPDIRMGACSCISSWTCDGVLPSELSKILAGKTKPFLRTIGAPYWAESKAWGNRLNDIIEQQRMEAVNRDADVETFSEGDVFPRPRFKIPAAYLELFDTALRADGHFDGILKYTIDYNSSMNNELGYTKRHVRNRPSYAWIDKNMSEKEAVGIRIYNNLHRIDTMNFAPNSDVHFILDNLLFSPAFKICSELSVPSVHTGEGIGGIAFGDDVRIVPKDAFRRGIIMDIEAACILHGQGVDVGFASEPKEVKPFEERFPTYGNEYFPVSYSAFQVAVRENAKISSVYSVKDENGRTVDFPAAYSYENANGEKFFIFTAKAYFQDESFIRRYPRALQLRDAAESLSGDKLPAFVAGNPDLMIMCKRGENETAVGLWNIFADSALDLEIELGETFAEAEFFGCRGELHGDKVILDEIPPFAFAGLLLKKH